MDVSKIIQFDKSNFAPINADGSESKMDKNVKKRLSGTVVSSVHANATQKTRGQATDAKIWRLVQGIHGYGELEVALASIPNGGYAEVYNKNTGDITLCSVTKTMPTGAIKPIMSFSACEMNALDVATDYATTRRGTALMAAHLAWACENDMEAKGALNELKTLIVEDPNDAQWDDAAYCERIGTLLCLLSSNIYYSYKNELDTEAQVNRMRQNDINNLSMKITQTHYGTLRKAKQEKASVLANAGMYNLNPKRVLTPEEENLVPKIPNTFCWEQWHLTVARDIQESTMFNEPFRVVMLGGPSGTGKSQGAGAIAHLLGRPRVIFTCDPDTDEFKLVGSTMPNTDGNTESKMDLDAICKAKGLPTFEDIAFDFKASYQKLFGTEPNEFAEEADCYKELFIKLGNTGSADFKFVKSELIKALENGWVVEVQEPTVIKRASVLVALNAMLDCDNNSAMITLPTGETIKRHPEAVVIYTTNADYAGCQAIQQSVLSRIDVIREIENPEIQVLVERAMANTGCKDKKSLETMAKVIREVNDYCKNQDISDGVCGPREFQNWIKKAMLTEMRTSETGTIGKTISVESICSAAFSTILSHVSQIPEDREDVITAVFGKTYQQADIQNGRMLYEKGVA